MFAPDLVDLALVATTWVFNFTVIFAAKVDELPCSLQRCKACAMERLAREADSCSQDVDHEC